MSDLQSRFPSTLPHNFALTGSASPGRWPAHASLTADRGFDAPPAALSRIIPVVIGAASPALLCGLESLVLATAGMCLGGTAQTLDDFLDQCLRSSDGVALVDPFLGRQTLREFMGALRAAAPKVRAVLMTEAHQPHLVREAMKTGACGLVGKAAGADEIRSALRAAADGRRYVAPAIAAQLVESLTLEDLTNREMQVLGLMSQGDCNKSIARVLDVTVGTVKTHVRAIMFKLDSRSRTEAVHKAYRQGLVCLNP
jgi:two-component system, NarL family, invasion response regulator UvrY